MSANTNTAVHAPEYGYGEPEKQEQPPRGGKEPGVAKGMVRFIWVCRAAERVILHRAFPSGLRALFLEQERVGFYWNGLPLLLLFTILWRCRLCGLETLKKRLFKNRAHGLCVASLLALPLHS